MGKSTIFHGKINHVSWENQPCFMGKSPFFMGKSTMFPGKINNFSWENQPFFMGKSPLQWPFSIADTRDQPPPRRLGCRRQHGRPSDQCGRSHWFPYLGEKAAGFLWTCWKKMYLTMKQWYLTMKQWYLTMKQWYLTETVVFNHETVVFNHETVVFQQETVVFDHQTLVFI